MTCPFRFSVRIKDRRDNAAPYSTLRAYPQPSPARPLHSVRVRVARSGHVRLLRFRYEIVGAHACVQILRFSQIKKMCSALPPYIARAYTSNKIRNTPELFLPEGKQTSEFKNRQLNHSQLPHASTIWSVVLMGRKCLKWCARKEKRARDANSSKQHGLGVYPYTVRSVLCS